MEEQAGPIFRKGFLEAYCHLGDEADTHSEKEGTGTQGVEATGARAHC